MFGAESMCQNIQDVLPSLTLGSGGRFRGDAGDPWKISTCLLSLDRQFPSCPTPPMPIESLILTDEK